MTKFAWGAATDVGQVRSVNQDHLLATDGLFAVADGMGGHRGGEVASEVAIGALQSYFDEPSTERLIEAVQVANEAIVERASGDPELRGMGTTMCVLARVLVDGEEGLTVVNVGDSRAYLLMPDGPLAQISEDHSLVATLERQGQITKEEAANHPQKNILTRALGIDQRVLADAFDLVPVQGDRYLLCSDGLFNEVDEATIADVLRSHAEAQSAAEELVRLANAGGGRDNISVVVVDVVDPGDPGDLLERSNDRRVVNAVHGADRAAPTSPPDPAAAASAAGAAAVAGRADDGDAARPAGATGTVVQGGNAPGGVSAPPASDVTGTAAPVRAAAKSRFTWRVVLFFVALAAIVAGGLYLVGYMANNTYYVKLDGQGEVVIYQGRPGGVLWYQPQAVESTGIRRDKVPPRFVAELEAGKDEGTLDEARAYVANIKREQAALVLGGAAGTAGTVPGGGGSTVTTSTVTTGVPTTTATASVP